MTFSSAFRIASRSGLIAASVAATGRAGPPRAARRARAMPAAATRERVARSSGASPNGGSSNSSIARPHSRTRSCAAAMSTERAAFSETTPSTRPAARWHSESASEPMTRRRVASPTVAPICSAMVGVVVPSKREDLDRLLRPLRAELDAVEECARTALGRPLLARPEVVDVAEHDVAHRRALRDREREREERDAALRVDRAVDGIDDDVSRLHPRRTMRCAELLGHEHEVARRARRDARRPRLRPPGRSPSCRRRPGRGGARARARRASAGVRALRGCRATHSRQVSSQGVMGRAGGRGGPRAAWDRSTCSSAACALPRERTAKTPPRRAALGAGTRRRRRPDRRPPVASSTRGV